MATIHSPLKYMTNGLLVKAGAGPLDEFLRDHRDVSAQVVAGKLFELTGGLFVADRRTVARWLEHANE